jgi:hypothetical protein
MRVMHAVRMANSIATSFGADLSKLDSVAVCIHSPGSCAAEGAFGLQAVFVRMLGELAAFAALAAAGVGFHLVISAIAQTIARRKAAILALSLSSLRSQWSSESSIHLA